MPGIAGLISQMPRDDCQRMLRQMVDCMAHEDFYVSGTYSAPELGVFAGWTAHEGSFSDCQPVLSQPGDLALIFSGEWFGDSKNADDFIRDYEKRGDHLVGDLNGLFCGLLIDRRERRSVLFN